jgi:type IV pilus assembly protein PilE
MSLISHKKFMRKAFTLLEMLVVIGIISVLVGLGATSYSTAQRKARDARRQSDLKTAQQVMEQCYSVNSFEYPTISANGGIISSTCPSPNTSITFSLADPLNNETYSYSYETSDTDYVINANLETNSAPFSVYNLQ